MTREQDSGRRAGPDEVTEWASRTRRRGPRWQMLAGALLAVAALAYLIVWGVRGAAVYSLTISELKARGPAAVGQGVRVTGFLDSGSVTWDAQGLTLGFVLRDAGGSLPVTYRGARPDGMSGDAEVIVEGKLLPNGSFQAKALLFKCPSRYEAGTPASETPPGNGR